MLEFLFNTLLVSAVIAIVWILLQVVVYDTRN